MEASVIVVGYNNKEFLKDCFTSLLKQSFRGFEIIYVDNSSKDGSVEYIRKNFPGEKLLRKLLLKRERGNQFIMLILLKENHTFIPRMLKEKKFLVNILNTHGGIGNDK